MHYGALPSTFERARELRKAMTEADVILWGKLKNKSKSFHKNQGIILIPKRSNFSLIRLP